MRSNINVLRPPEPMRVTEIRYRRLFEAARDGILLVDPSTRKITDANPFMSELLGYPHKELLGKELWEIGLLKDEEASRSAFSELRAQHFIRYEDLPLESKQGGRRDVEFVSNLYDEDGRDVIQCNVRDITERKVAESKISQLNFELAKRVVERTSQLQAANDELESFSHAISHDLRAPLRSMQGFAQVLLEDYGSKLDEEGVGHLQKIIRSSNRLDSLIQDVLSYSGLHRVKVLMQPVDLDRLMRDIIETYPNGRNAEFHIQGRLPTVLGNEAFLTQIFSNLLGNASKFVPAGTTPCINIRAEDREPSMTRVWIADNGIGIAPANHKRIFKMFEQINPTDEYKGSGIGLTIVRKAAERMGAPIGFESELGKGTSFWIELHKR